MLSVAVTVNVEVPGADGVPERFPEPDKINPGGNKPAVRVNVYGDAPPFAERAWPYPDPTDPSGREFGDNVIVGQLPTVIEYDRSPWHPFASVAVIVIVNVPFADGVPRRLPDGESVTPPGREPALTANVCGEVPPFAEID
jgi:hypothetical protein